MRWIRAAFLVAALAVMVLPCALMPFAPSTIGAENRLPAAWPALADENGVNYAFPGQYEDWLRDHVALRGTWIGLYSRALRALGASSEPQVILGKGDWLFFRETLNDYTGAEPLTDGEITRLALTLDTVDAGLRARGSALVLAVVPNKATVYPEYMNAAYPRRAAPGSAERLREAVHAAWVPLLDVLQAHAAEGLYFHQDTHWNALGARYAAEAILTRLGEETGVEIPLPEPAAPSELREDWHSDLARLLDPYTEACEQQRYYADKPAFSYQGRYRTPEDLTIRTAGGAAPLKLLVLRDSFTNQLLEDISGAVGEVAYMRAMPLPLDAAADADAVLLEMVERRLPELLAAPPAMSAPEALLPEDVADAAVVPVRLESEAAGDGVRFFGALERAPERLRAVRLGVRTATDETWYSAFPVSGVEGDGDRGFSARLDAAPADAEVCVYMLGSDGAAVTSGWVHPNE